LSSNAGDRTYLSIGEVLSLLKEEFADVTISKIRFLESQGLLDPERTPSGYRKFYPADVERLRWILRQQREHFLPLKVIKGRLGGDAEPATGADVLTDEREPEERAPSLAPAPGDRHNGRLRADAVRRPVPAAVASSPPGPAAPRHAPGPVPGDATPVEDDPERDEEASFTLQELAEASRVDADSLREIERYGLISSQRPVGGVVYYGRDALEVATIAAGFRRFGVEARHLRMYKTAAEREAGFFEQVVMPMLKQRNPQARRRAVETIVELVRLAGDLRAAMLKRALSEYLDSP
jgi:DNA-binding transcriptional MerR regulator